MGTVSAPTGLVGAVVIGQFVGTTENGGRQFLLVRFFRKAWGKDVDQRIEFTPYDPRTGEPTQVGDAIRNIPTGALVAVGCDVDARPWKNGAFATFSAESVHKVDPVSTDGHVRDIRDVPRPGVPEVADTSAAG